MTVDLYTPVLHVNDPRGRVVRVVEYCRRHSAELAQERITRYGADLAARRFEDWDPRVWAAALPCNAMTLSSLGGEQILENSTDGGWHLSLYGADHQSILHWDGRGSFSQLECDDLLRPIQITECLGGAENTVVERFAYGDASAEPARHNQCGRLIRHDDPAGTRAFPDYALCGAAMVENRRFLNDLCAADWPQDFAQRDACLQPGEGHETRTAFNATAAVVGQTDAEGNERRYIHTIAGELKESRLRRVDWPEAQTVVSNIRYSAEGHLLSQRLGNDVTTEISYEPLTGRLARMVSKTVRGSALQHLIYQYDAKGNVIEVKDASQPTRFFARRKTEPVSRYLYDSLYQLIQANGREVSTGASHGPALPLLQSLQPDPNNLSPYTQHYEYDASGNLLQLRHLGAQPFTRTMLVTPGSNRSLPQDETGVDLDDGFDANGNLQALIRGQSLRWDLRNQLRQVTAVQREDSADDDEFYVYDGAGQRCRKIRTAKAASRTLTSEVRYLPGLEIRREPDGKVLHVCTVQAGRSHVRLLHWAANKPEGIDNDQLRYSLNDHLGSSTLELDDNAARISEEGYYPYGGTSWWAARSAVEAKYKTVRYSGKERDANGLYYYGFRYYAPWLQRWISPDPLGGVDGLNRYRMVANSPIGRIDYQGSINIPFDILVADVVNVMNPSIGTGSFEELVWNQASQSLTSTGNVYTRGMAVMQHTTPSWRPSASGSAAAMFRDSDDRLRFFVNEHQQHMGIQPGMGLPLAAGVLRSAADDPTRLIFENHSGHYKPPSSIDVGGLLSTFARQAQITYRPLEVFNQAEDIVRVEAIDSPETYSDVVERYKGGDKHAFIDYLKQQGLWQKAADRQLSFYSLDILKIMEPDRTMTAADAINQHTRAEVNAQAKNPSTRTAPALSRQMTRTHRQPMNPIAPPSAPARSHTGFSFRKGVRRFMQLLTPNRR